MRPPQGYSEKELESINSLSEDDVRKKTRLNYMTIRDKLEKKAKRINPDLFVPCSVRFFNDPARKILMGSHSYLQAIEANCAFHKSGYNEPMDWNKFADIVNLCRQLEDENPFYLWTVHKNINLFFQFVYRIQLELQKTGFSKTHIARYWKIFYDNKFTSKLNQEFEKEYRISIKKWFLCSFCTYATFNKSLIVTKNVSLPSWINIIPDDIHIYLSYILCDIETVRKKYFETRTDLSEEFHFLIRSIFIEKPILELQNHTMIAPIPELIIKSMGKGLTTLFEMIDKDGYYLGQSFQHYTESVIRCLKNIVTLHTSDNLEKKSNGQKNCDFIIGTPTENILIECKAIDFKVRTLTENAISKSSATTRIIDAINQLSITYDNIQAERLVLDGINKTKPWIGIIVTLGDLPGFNTDWFFEKVLPSNNTKNKIDKTVHDFLNDKKPVILSIDSLEELVMYLNTSPQPFIDLYNSKMQQQYFMTGDWDVFLNNKIREIGGVKNLCYVNTALKQMLIELGIQCDFTQDGNFINIKENLI